jgi:hypothetical protein
MLDSDLGDLVSPHSCILELCRWTVNTSPRLLVVKGSTPRAFCLAMPGSLHMVLASL